MARQVPTIMTKTVSKDKGGTRIAKAKYDAVRKALLSVVPKRKDGIAFTELPKLVAPKLPAEMLPAKGSATWLTVVVKLDLEARGMLQRVEGVKPQRVRRLK